jgi:hypothetical protein
VPAAVAWLESGDRLDEVAAALGRYATANRRESDEHAERQWREYQARRGRDR